MKNVLALVLTIVCFASPAFAERPFICSSANQVIAHLTVGDPFTKTGSYNECNGGVGDEMTDCHTREYQIQVQEADIRLNLDGDELFSHMELSLARRDLYGFDILIYKDKAIHATLKGNENHPILNLRIMAKGTPGNPVEVGNYVLTCN